MILTAKLSFAAFDHVPRQALTCTVPTLLAGHEFFCCVTGLLKSAAVQAMPDSPESGECPAAGLRIHSRCTLYLDRNTSSKSQHHAPFNDHRP